MNNDHFAAFACGFVSAWICFQIQAEALHRITRRKPRPRKPSSAELLMPPRDQDPDWRRSFNHDNTNKKPAGASRPLLFRRQPHRGYPMSPERDLIQRLADELQVWIDNAECDIGLDEQALIEEARAYLAQTELRGGTTPPTETSSCN